MANWCSNNIEFLTNEPEQLKTLQVFFEAMADREKETQNGQLPAFTKEESGWLFEIRWEGDILYYETKWSPNAEVIQEIADHFGVGFIYQYGEVSNSIYGEYEYENGILTDTCLDYEDFMQYSYDDETDLYTFEGETYESDTDILDMLWDRKKIANDHSANITPLLADLKK